MEEGRHMFLDVASSFGSHSDFICTSNDLRADGMADTLRAARTYRDVFAEAKFFGPCQVEVQCRVHGAALPVEKELFEEQNTYSPTHRSTVEMRLKRETQSQYVRTKLEITQK